MKSRAQVGLEYIVLFGLVLAVTLGIAYSFYNDFQFKSREFQARIAVDKLVDAADTVAAQGQGSSTRVLVYFPSGISNATASGREVSMTVLSTGGRAVTMFDVTLANLTFSQLPTIENRYSFLVTFTGINVTIALE